MADPSAPTEHPASSIFPPLRVRVTTPRVELRLPTDEEIVALDALAGDGIHDPSFMPFGFPWTDELPGPRGISTYQAHARKRATWKPESWACMFALFVDGEPAGAQEVGATEFGIRREVGSGSWIGARFQGRGLGTEMREAMLHFVFDGLGALAANSGAYDDNPASNRVSQKAGYERNGVGAVVRRRGPAAPDGKSAERAIEVLYRIERDAWLAQRRDDIVIHGLDEDVLTMFGVTPER
jgi:RimJ/RimL family protein N-acetyltransferase